MEPDELNMELARMVTVAAARFREVTALEPAVVILPLEFRGRGLSAIGYIKVVYGHVSVPVVGVGP